ncbi:MAG: maleylpyruvate isomerase family mycothiol-dependent enzyme [Ilumatobacteraceae bacterium]
MSETTSRPDAAIAAARAADQELLDRLERWSRAGGDPGAPSVLDGWTIGHVVTHLARNADGFRNVARGTAVGEQWPMYESVESRQADIDAGAGRSAEELSADLRQAVDRLYAALAEADWAGSGLTARGPIAMIEVPERRRREVIVHHSDLGLGYTPDEWPSDFVRTELRALEMVVKSRLPMGMTEWPAAVLGLTPGMRLWWMFGRLHGEGLPVPPAWQ